LKLRFSPQVNKHIEGGFLDYVVLKDNYKAWTADPAFLATKDVVFVSTDVFPGM
jgi:hypothetical protein